MRVLSLALPLLLAACGSSVGTDSSGGAGADTTDTASGDTADSNDTSGGDTDSGGGDTDTGTNPGGPRVTADGEVTWSVDFGPESEAAGMEDCAYVRHYSGGEDRSAPWLCPGCDVVFKLDVELTSGRADCYDLIADSDPPETEYIGYGGGVWYRGAGTWLTERGAATVTADSVTIEQSATSEELGADYGFEIGGTLTLGSDDGDPYGGFFPPDTYACGWPKSDAPEYAGDYVGEIGATLPDGAFTDICDEPVRLHDFAGEYLIVDISAMDCGPCQQAAGEEEAFVEEMAAAGTPVHVTTLLAPSLSDTAGTPTHRELQQWIDAFELTSPVLADRVWGLSVIGQQIPDEFGYPTFVIVSPDLEILDIQVGYGGWDGMSAVIAADAQ